MIYDSMTSSRDDWWTGNIVLTETTTEGTKIYTTSNSEARYFKTTPVSVPHSMEFTWVDGGGQQYYSAVISSKLDVTDDGSYWIAYNTNNYIVLGSYKYDDVRFYNQSLVSGDTIKIISTTDTAYIYKNDELIGSHAIPSFNEDYVGFYTKSNRWQKIKDLKIKPYSE